MKQIKSEDLRSLYSEFVNKPVYMHPKKLLDWLDRIETNDFVFFEDDDAQDEPSLEVSNGVAIIRVEGPLTNFPKDDWAVRAGYVGSYPLIKEQFDEAISREDVKSVAFKIDSPGGMGSGLFDLMDHLYNNKDVKPVYSLVDEDAFSAAYGIASTAGKNRIWAVRSGMVGSVGSIIVHRDVSKALDEIGIKYTAFTYGKKKAQFASFNPLSEEAAKDYQSLVDEHGKEFTELVSRNLRASFNSIKDLEAGIFSGKHGIEAGLASRIVPFSEALEEIGAKYNMQQTSNKEVTSNMDLKELKEKHAALYAEVVAEVKASLPAQAEPEDREDDPRFAEMQAKIDEQDKKIKDYDKREAIRAMKEIEFTADAIWKDQLHDCNIPDALHGKIKKQVDFKSYVKETGFDSAAFTEAVKTEVKDWEGLSAQTTIQGFGTLPSDDKNKETDDRADGLLAAAGQKPQK